MRPDYDLNAMYAREYDRLNYSQEASRLLALSHDLLEKSYGPEAHFGTVLEVGAGGGQHLRHVRHRYDRYIMTDMRADLLEASMARQGGVNGVEVRSEDAGALSMPDASVDRLIASHVLEHLPDPHEVLREWYRVVRPGGVLSILLPCDPGLLWRVGRSFGPRRAAQKTGMPYDYVMAREHINSIFNLRALIDYYFGKVPDAWWPARVALPDLNLFYVCHIPRV